MKRQEAALTEDLALQDAAMHWLLRLREETVTEQDIGEWARWYESDERNKLAFDQMQGFWRQAGDLVADPERAQRLRRLGRARPEPALMRPRWLRSGLPKAELSLALAASLVVAAGLTLTARSPGRSDASTMQATAARETLLPDGSRVELAPRSSVQVQYSEARRLLQMHGGEAYFSVAHNRARPFVVRVGGLDVRAVGTEFNIREAGDRIVVTVTQGIVDVYPTRAEDGNRADEPAPGGVRIGAGNQVAWAGQAESPTVTAVDAAHAAAWKEGRLEYIDEPLSSVIADVSRYAEHPIRIGDAAVGKLAFTGTVFTQSTGDWLQSLPGEFPIAVRTAPDGSTILVSAQGVGR